MNECAVIETCPHRESCRLYGPGMEPANWRRVPVKTKAVTCREIRQIQETLVRVRERLDPAVYAQAKWGRAADLCARDAYDALEQLFRRIYQPPRRTHEPPGTSPRL